MNNIFTFWSDGIVSALSSFQLCNIVRNSSQVMQSNLFARCSLKTYYYLEIVIKQTTLLRADLSKLPISYSQDLEISVFHKITIFFQLGTFILIFCHAHFNSYK